MKERAADDDVAVAFAYVIWGLLCVGGALLRTPRDPETVSVVGGSVLALTWMADRRLRRYRELGSDTKSLEIPQMMVRLGGIAGAALTAVPAVHAFVGAGGSSLWGVGVALVLGALGVTWWLTGFLVQGQKGLWKFLGVVVLMAALVCGADTVDVSAETLEFLNQYLIYLGSGLLIASLATALLLSGGL